MESGGRKGHDVGWWYDARLARNRVEARDARGAPPGAHPPAAADRRPASRRTNGPARRTTADPARTQETPMPARIDCREGSTTMVDDAQRMRPVRDLLRRLVERDGVPGAALAVAVDGDLVFEHYEGDAADDRP